VNGRTKAYFDAESRWATDRAIPSRIRSGLHSTSRRVQVGQHDDVFWQLTVMLHQENVGNSLPGDSQSARVLEAPANQPICEGVEQRVHQRQLRGVITSRRLH
jgi:hypothetical protein